MLSLALHLVCHPAGTALGLFVADFELMKIESLFLNSMNAGYLDL
jgi:hypothetical protein